MIVLSSSIAARFTRGDGQTVRWACSPGLVPYLAAVTAMERQAQAIAEGSSSEMVWLLEHPPLYSAGVSAKPADLLAPDRFPVFASGRGGQFTYHGPGQRVAYAMLDLRARSRDTRAFVNSLEAWVIGALAGVGVCGETRRGRVGVWVRRSGSGREDKVAAIGVKLRRWISFHGVSINIAPDLSHFAGIVPCGISDHGVTSLADLGVTCDMAAFDAALLTAFIDVFGPTTPGPPPAFG